MSPEGRSGTGACFLGVRALIPTTYTADPRHRETSPKGFALGKGSPLVRGGFKPTKCCQGPHFSKPSRTSMPRPSLATPGDRAHRAQRQTTNNGLVPGTGSDSAMTAAAAPWATFPSAITATRAGLCRHKARGPVGVLGAWVAGTLALAVERHLACCSWCPSHRA